MSVPDSDGSHKDTAADHGKEKADGSRGGDLVNSSQAAGCGAKSRLSNHAREPQLITDSNNKNQESDLTIPRALLQRIVETHAKVRRNLATEGWIEPISNELPTASSVTRWAQCLQMGNRHTSGATRKRAGRPACRGSQSRRLRNRRRPVTRRAVHWQLLLGFDHDRCRCHRRFRFRCRCRRSSRR